MRKHLVPVLAALWLTACGGGGGSSSSAPPAPPAGGGTSGGTEPAFGLTTRDNLAAFNLPGSGTGAIALTLAEAYPGLTFNVPIYAASVPGENRLVVVEQSGRLQAFVDTPGATTARTVLDLSSVVTFAGEQGLLGLAFDPAFTTNRYLYVHYSASGPRRSVVARFTWEAASDQALRSSEKVILEVAQPFTNHNGGSLAFGPDNYLYIALGDGGSGGDPQNHGQDRSTLLGSVLRLDVHPASASEAYAIPPDNPFVGVSGVREEIYAYGLRNPFRFSFDQQSGELWLGDVGQNAIEEIDRIEAGGNYGWRVFEGTEPFDRSGNTLPDSAFSPPVFEYDHSQGRSVIGGYVYRGSRHAALFGRYLFADYVSGNVWALDPANPSAGATVVDRATNPAGFAEKNDGELLLVTIGGSLLEFVSSGGTSGEVPDKLSETGLFADLASLTPAAGLIEYAVTVPFHSDGAEKRRWAGIPGSATVAFGADDWSLPTGSVLVKHFTLETTDGPTRLETRVLARGPDEWAGFTYRWDAAGSDADLLLARETTTFTVPGSAGPVAQRYDFPSRTDCFACHTDAAGVALGLRTPQLNRDFDYDGVVDNQLRSWNNIGLFDTALGDAAGYDAFPAIADEDASVADRARAYLDVNCAHCHQPGGTAPGALDLRVATADDAMGALNTAPSAGNLGITDAAIIAPGERNRSVLWERLRRLDDNRMPPLGSHVVDSEGVDLVGRWIDALSE